jgi:hypothetical protein
MTSSSGVGRFGTGLAETVAAEQFAATPSVS